MKGTTRTNRPLKVMQFGGGKFLRAFAVWMIEELNQKTNFNGGVLVVKPTKGGDYLELREQKGRFHVLLNDWEGNKIVTTVKEIDCVEGIVNPYKEWELFLDYANDASLRYVISNTTEAGITFNPKDNFHDDPPNEFPAKLTRVLFHRYKHFGNDPSKGLIILPCELIHKNGEALKKCVLEYAAAWKLDGEFIRWVALYNKFYNTLVDRIVSGYPVTIAPEIQQQITFDDKLMVTGEFYHSWVIQADVEITDEFPVDEAGLNVTFVSDIMPYHDLKVRVLNGAHTAMVFLGSLLELVYVHEVVEDRKLNDFLDALIRNEILMTMDIPTEIKDQFYHSTINRFRNHSLKHRLADISLNSSHKYVSRLWPTIIDYVDTFKNTPDRLAFITACMVLFFRGAYKGNLIALNDDQDRIQNFSGLWQLYLRGELSRIDLVHNILVTSGIPEKELDKGFIQKTAFYIKDIEGKGVMQVLEGLV
ncbi:tagaturonate reductase [Zhouia amylolytica]|uniref:Tagaturonate reductase n=1 Tax=Zhouia amylolytica TaxID=376730 RepID=A0A1I6VLI7_9FLAO|nr:tagaturonate reductase [Zhouia amylolytica]SFT14578.1 tagaturonate reductase [Zhouia amylolytica]